MKRRGRKSAAQTPAPRSERIVGSSKNPKGSASSKSSASKIQISKEVEEVLKKKAKDYNESHQSKVTLATLKAVFRRGAGAYSSSHRPTIGGGKPNSRTAWAYARVNKFLLKKGGTKVKAAYVQDDDLMAKGGLTSQNVVCHNCGWTWDTKDSSPSDKYVCHKCGYDNSWWYGNNKYNNGGLIDAIGTSIENLKKNGIVIKDNDNTNTLIAYNTGNQERNPSLYNKSLIYSSVQPLRSANEIIANLDSMDYEHFDIDRLEEYRNDHLIILNQNEVVYDSGKSDIKYERGAIIENQFDDLGNNQLVQVLKSFYSDLSENPIFENLDLKEGDYTFNLADNQFVLFRGNPFSNIERIKIGRFLQPYFDASKKPLFARFFDSYNVSGNNLIIKVKDMYEEGGEMTSDATIALPDTYSSIDKLKEILNTRGYDIVTIDKSIGKLAKGMTIEDIAEKHGVSVEDLNIELENGIKSEMEHTDDKMVAKAIALDHLYENPKYYSKLQSLNFENGGVMEKGGMVVGKSHQEADENGTGEKFIVSSTGQIVELEGGEAVIVGEALNSDDELEFEGQKKSPREIASYLNHAYGGVKFERGGHVDCGCNKKYYHGGELPSAVVDKLSGGEAVITKKTMESKDKYTFEGEKLTPRQILSRINHKYGGVSFAKGGEIGAKRFSPEIKLAKMVYFVNNIKNG